MEHSRKRQREESPHVGTVSFDEAWHGDDYHEAGAIAIDDDSLPPPSKRISRVSPAVAQSRAAPKRGIQNTILDDLWGETRLVASGAVLGDLSVAIHSKCHVELTVNREVVPPFLRDGKVLFSRQQSLVLPLKDSDSAMARSSKAGSEALRSFRRSQAERRQVREALTVDGSDFAAIVLGKASSMSAEEKERLEHRLERQKMRIISPENAKQQEKREMNEEVKRVKENASLRSIEGPDHNTPFQRSPKELRKSLPIFQCRDELLRSVRENDVVVVVGETGSGKTTQIVQYLYESGFASDTMIIGCTQPRRMATVSVADRVSKEVGCPLGTVVGYTIRLEDATTPETKIRFMTDGVLMQELVRSPTLSKYSILVMDEAHERSVNTDVLLGVMRDILRVRSDFKVIVTSATMDVEKFAKFFGSAPIFRIPGRTFEVAVRYEGAPVVDYVELAVLKAVEIHLQSPPGDILIFMTGKDDVDCTCALISDRLASYGPQYAESLLILPCYSVLPGAEQLRILAPPPPGKRKCIVATNVAETSITIDGIRYVVDSGFMKTNVFKPSVGMNTLQIYPVSQAQANQRKGRAGRTADGVCFRLYTDTQFLEELLPDAVPEIQRSSLDSVVLLLKSIAVRDLFSFEFIDPPPNENLRNSLYHLWMLGAVDGEGEITQEGRLMADIPTEPTLSKVIVQSTSVGCAEEVLVIVSMMAVDPKGIFQSPRGREDEAILAREKFYCPESDHLTLLNVFRQFRDSGRSRSWAAEHFVNYNSMERACDIRVQLYERIVRILHLPVESCEENLDAIRRCLAFGYFPRAAKRKSIAEYMTLLSGVPCFVHPTSATNAAGVAADYVVYNDFILTTKQFMSVVTAVEPQWLVEASRGIFRILGTDVACQSLLAVAQHKAASQSKSRPEAIISREQGLAQRQVELARRKRPGFSL